MPSKLHAIPLLTLAIFACGGSCSATGQQPKTAYVGPVQLSVHRFRMPTGTERVPVQRGGGTTILADDNAPSLTETIKYIQDRCGTSADPYEWEDSDVPRVKHKAWLEVESATLIYHDTTSRYEQTITIYIKGLDGEKTNSPIPGGQNLGCKSGCPKEQRIHFHIHYPAAQANDGDEIADHCTLYPNVDWDNYKNLNKAFKHLIELVNGKPEKDPFG